MAVSCSWESIDVHLLQVLHALLTECSVSNAARRLNQSQPAVSTALRCLRDITGDPLLVRSRNGMTPTERGMALLEPVKIALQQIETLAVQQVRFNPAQTRRVFNIATPDYLNASLVSQLVGQLRRTAPQSQIAIHSLGPNFDVVSALEHGDLDVVIGNWPQPPDDLHMGRLFGDEVVCLVGKDHPAVRRGWDVESWLAAEHIAPTPTHPGARGVIDAHLDSLGMQRHITARCAHFSLIPSIVASSLLVLTTGRQYCERYVEQLPLAILPCPVPFPRLMYYQLWHARTHHSAAAAWLRDCVKTVAASLRKE